MLFVDKIRPELRVPLPDNYEEMPYMDKLYVKRSFLQAVTHVDFSARVQTVSRTMNPMFWELLRAFKRKADCSVLVNTSFNVRGEPIVCTPKDAYECFMKTGMDYLVMNNYLIQKHK